MAETKATNPARKQKILICGDVQGHFATFVARVKKINGSKHGPFDAVFCVGHFRRSGSVPAEYTESLPSDLPLPTYFLDMQSDPESKTPSDSESSGGHRELGNNLHSLRRSGLATVHGLSVAFVSDRCCEDDIVHLTKKAQVNAPDFRGVDLLLTCHWPSRVESGIPASLPSAPQHSLPAVAELAATLLPRYHFAGSEGIFLARPPYANQMTRSLAQVHATRFLGLGSVPPPGTKKKGKWLHALHLAPLHTMDAAELLVCPKGTTPSPYGGGNGGARGRRRPQSQSSQGMKRGRGSGGAGSGGWSAERAAQLMRLEENNGVVNGVRSGGFFFDPKQVQRKGRGGGRGGGRGVCYDFQKGKCNRGADCRFSHSADKGGGKGRGGGGPPRPCWFCLSTPGFEAHLVASINEEVYLSAPKGALVPGHFLLVPIDHKVSCVAAAPPELVQEIDQYTAALRKHGAANKTQLVVYEHNISRPGVMKHMHVQAIPVPDALAASVRPAFESVGSTAGVTFEVVPAGQALSVPDGAQYFRAVMPTGETLLYVVPTDGPPSSLQVSFGRGVLAAVLGTPEKRNWKTCVLPKDEETALVEKFKEGFKSYDPAGESC